MSFPQYTEYKESILVHTGSYNLKKNFFSICHVYVTTFEHRLRLRVLPNTCLVFYSFFFKFSNHSYEKKIFFANPTEKIKYIKKERKSDQTKWETISFTFQFISIQLYCIDKEIELITQIRSQCQSNNMMEI